MQESLFGVVMSDVSAPLHEILRQTLSVGETPLMITFEDCTGRVSLHLVGWVSDISTASKFGCPTEA